MKNYYKFVMFRHPVERLLSAYLDKIVSNDTFRHSNIEIYHYKYPQAKEDKYFEAAFTDFIDFWVDKRRTTGWKNPHFETVYQVCLPCQVKYDYYGNFNLYEHDAEVLMKRIGYDSTILRKGYHKEGETTSDIAPWYYSLLSTKQKEKVIDELAMDLEFYYSIFPTEIDSHKTIMGIDYDVPKV